MKLMSDHPQRFLAAHLQLVVMVFGGACTIGNSNNHAPAQLLPTSAGGKVTDGGTAGR